MHGFHTHRIGAIRLVVPAVVVTAIVALTTASAGAAPRAVEIELLVNGRVGKQVAFLRWLHEVTFTASPPLCAAGTGVDLTATTSRPSLSDRVYTCADGSGTITARIVNHEVEYTPYAEATWQIVSGTGAFARLRGKGTLTGSHLSGDPSDPPTLTFRAFWKGIVAFDDVAPTVQITRVGATKLRRPRGGFLVKVAFSTLDDTPGNAVSYSVRMLGPTFQHRTSGTTTTGSVAVSFRTRPAASVRRLRLEITCEDPLGNLSRVTRVVTLPR